MSGQRAAAEPYATRFETEVTAIDGHRVWLERSHFYGASGGQPADRGTIGDVEVVDVRLVDGEQVHELAAEPSFRTGRSVLCSIDWSFRMYCMRAHTAGHVLYGAARRVLEDASYAGFEIDEDRETVRLDLETSSTVDDETLLELDRLVNRTVWESRSVSWDDVPIAEAREREDVTVDEGVADDAVQKGRVRLVTIGGKDENGNANGSSKLRGGFTVGTGGDPWDVSACGGTHVRNTREIGPVTVIGGSSGDDDITQFELAVGPRAIEHRTAEKRAAFAATRTLETSVETVPDELERVAGDRPERRRPVRRDGGGTGEAE